MRLHFLYGLILTAILIVVSGFAGKIHARMAEESRIIYPGKSIGAIRLNEPKPAGVPSFMEKAIKEGNIKLDFSDNKTVKKITITSDQFFVAVSALRIEHNNAGDVKKFYGNPYLKPAANNKISLRYPLQGLDFEIDRLSERITAIIIYMPDKRLRLPESEYRQYREQFKQMKQ